MTNIVKPDQHIASYIYQKQTDPDVQIVLRSFQRNVVDKVDRIIELAHGDRDFVKSESDWVVVEELVNFFATQWPQEYQDFKSAINDIRHTKRAGGYSKSKEIKHVGSMPVRLQKMIKIIFPAQQWDKKFTAKFIKRLPIFKVGGEQNLS